MKRTLLSLALTMALLLSACSAGVTALQPGRAAPEAPARRDAALDTALGDFGLELLRQTRTAGENTFVSPLSAALCLSMAADGAAGGTLAQFEAVLAGDGSLETLNANCASLLSEYAALEGETTLSIADGLWLDEGAQVEDAFLSRCTGTYQAGAFAADFSNPGTRKQINAWIERNTGGHIQNALKEIDPATVLALANAVYFEGKWAEEFDPDDTWEARPFYPEGGGEATVDLMSSGGREDRYIGTDAEQGVLLPYRDGRLAFLALMPSQGTPLGEYLDTLDGAALAGLITGAGTEYFTLCLPKFEMMWSGSLVGALQAMGLTDAFDPDAADFAPMGRDVYGNPLYISAVEHGAGIEVDEQGTRAFSFTFIGMSGAGAAPPEELVFDRPFVYGIVDLERGVPLFLGTFETG